MFGIRWERGGSDANEVTELRMMVAQACHVRLASVHAWELKEGAAFVHCNDYSSVALVDRVAPV